MDFGFLKLLHQTVDKQTDNKARAGNLQTPDPTSTVLIQHDFMYKKTKEKGKEKKKS